MIEHLSCAGYYASVRVEVLLFRYGETNRSEEEARHAPQGHTGKQRGQSGGRGDKGKVGKNLYYGFRWGEKKKKGESTGLGLTSLNNFGSPWVGRGWM